MKDVEAKAADGFSSGIARQSKSNSATRIAVISCALLACAAFSFLQPITSLFECLVERSYEAASSASLTCPAQDVLHPTPDAALDRMRAHLQSDDYRNTSLRALQGAVQQ